MQIRSILQNANRFLKQIKIIVAKQQIAPPTNKPNAKVISP